MNFIFISAERILIENLELTSHNSFAIQSPVAQPVCQTGTSGGRSVATTLHCNGGHCNVMQEFVSVSDSVSGSVVYGHAHMDP